jgi:hypothetical protein
MTKKILKFFENNPSAYYYLALLIVLVGSLFVAAIFGYIISMMES